MKIMSLTVKKIIRSVVFLILPLLLTLSCSCNKDDDSGIIRTVLVYIAADNNLSNTANSNIYSMNSAIRSGMKNVNLLVFVDRINYNPALLHLHDAVIDTVKTFPEMDSTDPDVFRDVIEYVRKNYISDSYGLVMWSHGTGWLPASQLHFVAPNMGYSPSRDGDGNHLSVLDIQRYPSSLQTKAFGLENRKGNNPPYVCMEIDEMANAIPDGVFDFIAFDACYMGNVEIVYALRKKARYFISSTYEIVSYGFPYHIVTRDLLEGNLTNVCREFYTYYNSMSGWEQMGGISLVDTDGLDSLAQCFKKIVVEYKDSVPELDISEIQVFDRFRNHVFFDLGDVVEKLCPNLDYVAEFNQQLDKCVQYKASTPYMFQGDYEEIKIDKYCGLSIYIPIRRYESSGLNDDYRMTEWSKVTGY